MSAELELLAEALAVVQAVPSSNPVKIWDPWEGDWETVHYIGRRPEDVVAALAAAGLLRGSVEADVIAAAEEVARWVDDIDLSLHPCCNDRDYAPNAMQAQQDALAALSAAVAALRAAREDTDR